LKQIRVEDLAGSDLKIRVCKKRNESSRLNSKLEIERFRIFVLKFTVFEESPSNPTIPTPFLSLLSIGSGMNESKVVFWPSPKLNDIIHDFYITKDWTHWSPGLIDVASSFITS